jgi:hypothetical protein
MAYTDLKNTKDFGHYNELPKGFKIVNEEEFAHRFFEYIIAGEIYRQPFGEYKNKYLPENEFYSAIKMFPLAYADCSQMGYGIASVYHSKTRESKIVFFRFGEGERWQALQNEMAAQFAGDNS